jgi:hypothetical protein
LHCMQDFHDSIGWLLPVTGARPPCQYTLLWEQREIMPRRRRVRRRRVMMLVWDLRRCEGRSRMRTPKWDGKRHTRIMRKPELRVQRYRAGMRTTSADNTRSSTMAGHTLPRLPSIRPTLFLCGSGMGLRGIARSDKSARTVLRDIRCPKSARSAV